MVLAALSFARFKFVHPFRVTRLRGVSLAVVGLWAVLAMVALARELAPGPWVAGGLLAAALYLLGVGLTDRAETDGAT